jgi:hypothetical protein
LPFKCDLQRYTEGEEDGKKLVSADGSPIVSPGGKVIDWEAVYSDIDRTREAADSSRRTGEGKGTTRGTSGAVGESSSSKAGKIIDWEAVYADIEETRAAKRGAVDGGSEGETEGEGEDVAPITPRAGASGGGGGKPPLSPDVRAAVNAGLLDPRMAPAADRASSRGKQPQQRPQRPEWQGATDGGGGASGGAVHVDSPWPIAERRLVSNPYPWTSILVSKCAFKIHLVQLHSGELVGDLYKKLAALGATSAGELLMQSPTVKNQLSRMQWWDDLLEKESAGARWINVDFRTRLCVFDYGSHLYQSCMIFMTFC